MLDKGGRNIFMYFLQPDDFLTTGGTVSLPYLFLPRNTRVDQVIWTPEDRITVLTHSIVSGTTGSAIYRLDLSHPAQTYAFVRTDDSGIHGVSLDSANSRYVVLLTAKGLILKDYASWKTVRTIAHPDPLHVLWTGAGNLVVAGRYYTELIDISSAASVGASRGGASRFLAFSQAEKYGYSVGNGNIEIEAKGIARAYDPSNGTWSTPSVFRVSARAVGNNDYRVYVEPLVSTSYTNMVMVRNLQGVDTTALFRPPEQSYEPFPKVDQPVDLTDFNHGSRIRRREVALVFNAIAGVDGLTQVLNVLKEYNMHATFFVNGQFIREHPGAVKELADSGQEVGSLFFSYFNMVDSRYRIGTQFIKQGLARNEDEYYRATGKELSQLWHAPFYFLSPDVLQASREMNYSYIGRDVDSLDWVPKHDDGGLSRLYHPSADLINRILSEKKPGSIITMTIGKPQDNLASENVFVSGRDDYLFGKLDVLLNGLIEKGYTAVTVSTLMDHAH
jgi:peptidoglycan/xylan/chitin deacetylase (PgdA/CDA1 family)